MPTGSLIATAGHPFRYLADEPGPVARAEERHRDRLVLLRDEIEPTTVGPGVVEHPEAGAYCPGRNVARDGQQSGKVANAFANVAPRSWIPVRTACIRLKSSARWSSVRTTTKFGRLWAASSPPAPVVSEGASARPVTRDGQRQPLGGQAVLAQSRISSKRVSSARRRGPQRARGQALLVEVLELIRIVGQVVELELVRARLGRVQVVLRPQPVPIAHGLVVAELFEQEVTVILGIRIGDLGEQ